MNICIKTIYKNLIYPNKKIFSSGFSNKNICFFRLTDLQKFKLNKIISKY